MLADGSCCNDTRLWQDLIDLVPDDLNTGVIHVLFQYKFIAFRVTAETVGECGASVCVVERWADEFFGFSWFLKLNTEKCVQDP